MEENIEKILIQIENRLCNIDEQQRKINGRLGVVERLAALSDKAIAVIVAESKMSDHEQEGINKRFEFTQARNEERIFDFVKKNGLQIGELSALIYLVGKQVGWW